MYPCQFRPLTVYYLSQKSMFLQSKIRMVSLHSSKASYGFPTYPEYKSSKCSTMTSKITLNPTTQEGLSWHTLLTGCWLRDIQSVFNGCPCPFLSRICFFYVLARLSLYSASHFSAKTISTDIFHCSHIIAASP